MTITTETLIALMPLLIVGLTVVVVMLSIAWRRNYKLSTLLTLTGLLISLFATLITSQTQSNIVHVGRLLNIDFYSSFYTTLVLLAAIATSVFGYSWLKSYPDNKEEFNLMLLISTMGGILLSSASHLATLFVGIELLSLPMFGLIGYAFRRDRSLEAAIKYMVLSATASSFLVFGMALLYAANGDLTFAELGRHLDKTLGMPLQLAGLGLLLVGFGFKLSLVPFHMWTPDVYEGAPAPVSGFLATAGKIAALSVLGRFFLTAPVAVTYSVSFIISLLAFCSILLGNLLAIKQNNVKRIMGYSSISHLGYMLIALVIIRQTSQAGDLLNASEALAVYLVGYLLSSIVAFGVISMVSSPYQNEDVEMIEQFKGLFWKNPIYALCLAVMMLSLAGIPLTVGFIGKFYVIAIGAMEGLWWLLAALIAGSAMGLYYYLRIAVILFQSRDENEKPTSCITSPLATAIIIVATLLVLIWGIFPGMLSQLASLVIPMH